MKRKTVAIIMALALTISLSACGQVTSNNNSYAERIDKLEQKNEELEQRIEELQAQLENQESSEISWEPTNETERLFKVTIESPEINGVCGPNLTWYYSNGVFAITGFGEMTDYSIYTDTPWYDIHDKIAWVIIDEGATTIGNETFAYCDQLSKIVLPSTMEYINTKNTFYGSDNIKEVVYNGETYAYDGKGDYIEDYMNNLLQDD